MDIHDIVTRIGYLRHLTLYSGQMCYYLYKAYVISHE